MISTPGGFGFRMISLLPYSIPYLTEEIDRRLDRHEVLSEIVQKTDLVNPLTSTKNPYSTADSRLDRSGYFNVLHESRRRKLATRKLIWEYSNLLEIGPPITNGKLDAAKVRRKVAEMYAPPLEQ